MPGSFNLQFILLQSTFLLPALNEKEVKVNKFWTDVPEQTEKKPAQIFKGKFRHLLIIKRNFVSGFTVRS